MTNRTSFLLAISVLIMPLMSAGADEIRLQCEMSDGNFIDLFLNQDEETAVLVLDTSSVDGTMSATETHYRLVFPKTEQRYETHIAVNRLSGALSWEHGDPPFGELSPQNISRRGTCAEKDPATRIGAIAQ